MKRLAVLAMWLAVGPALAQTPAAPAEAACVAAADIEPEMLYGLWQLSLWPLGGDPGAPSSTGAVLFVRHPDYPGSVRGLLKRSSERAADALAQVAGDVTGGEFNLDESADGVAMDAVWTGTPTDCARRIQGERRPAEGRPAHEPTLNFLLQKAPGARR